MQPVRPRRTINPAVGTAKANSLRCLREATETAARDVPDRVDMLVMEDSASDGQEQGGLVSTLNLTTILLYHSK